MEARGWTLADGVRSAIERLATEVCVFDPVSFRAASRPECVCVCARVCARGMDLCSPQGPARGMDLSLTCAPSLSLALDFNRVWQVGGADARLRYEPAVRERGARVTRARARRPILTTPRFLGEFLFFDEQRRRRCVRTRPFSLLALSRQGDEAIGVPLAARRGSLATQ